MAEEGTLAVREDVLKFAGDGANSTATAEAYTNVYIKMAEGVVCAQSRYDWVTDVASISTVGKEALRIAVASLAAMMAIEYDMSGYTSRVESQVMLDILRTQAQDIINLLRDNNFKAWILNAGGTID